tara:strand:+ start:437 stop:727 length:291 start_codon:yes stop_codon:yes gene_type:complete
MTSKNQKELAELNTQSGRLGSPEDVAKEQFRLRVAEMKDIVGKSFDQVKQVLGLKGMNTKEIKTALKILFPRTIKRETKQNKGGLIDYRKTGMFKK